MVTNLSGWNKFFLFFFFFSSRRFQAGCSHLSTCSILGSGFPAYCELCHVGTRQDRETHGEGLLALTCSTLERKRHPATFHWQGKCPQPKNQAAWRAGETQGRPGGHQRPLLNLLWECLGMNYEVNSSCVILGNIFEVFQQERLSNQKENNNSSFNVHTLFYLSIWHSKIKYPFCARAEV